MSLNVFNIYGFLYGFKEIEHMNWISKAGQNKANLLK